MGGCERGIGDAKYGGNSETVRQAPRDRPIRVALKLAPGLKRSDA